MYLLQGLTLLALSGFHSTNAAPIDNTLLPRSVVSLGILPAVSNGQVTVGTDGPYTSQIVNSASQSFDLVCWLASTEGFVKAYNPSVVTTVAPGASTTLTFANGATGACAPVYASTTLTANGQINNTWWEWTFEPSGTMDISREVNANGNAISSHSPAGCTASLTNCAFVCPAGESSCAVGYEVTGCTGGGAEDGTSYGCGWNGASSAALVTTFS